MKLDKLLSMRKKVLDNGSKNLLTPWKVQQFVQVVINGKTKCRVHKNFVWARNLYIPNFKQWNEEKLIDFKIKVHKCKVQE